MAEDTPLTTSTTHHPLDEHEPRGTPDEARTILTGLASPVPITALPQPRLVHDFRLRARLETKVALGPSCWGERNWIGICGGEWSATWGKGTIVVRKKTFAFLIPTLSCDYMRGRKKKVETKCA